MPTVGETARGLRDRPLGKVLVLVAVLLAAVLVSRSCGETSPDVSQDEAVEIARGEVDFEPDEVVVRYLKRGLNQEAYWLVGLSLEGPDGARTRATNVLVHAETGDVAGVQAAIP